MVSNMNILGCALFALVSFTVVLGEPCKFNVPVTSGVVKCGDQIYPRSADSIAAVNECAQGRNGTDITYNDVKCYNEKRGILKNGVIDKEVRAAHLKQEFPQHHQALADGLQACCDENKKDNQANDQLKPVACIMKLFEDVCKHKTCDWLNTLD